MTGSPRAKENALEANKKNWGIGAEAPAAPPAPKAAPPPAPPAPKAPAAPEAPVALSPGSRMTGSPRAKENALEANKKNWGIGAEAPAAPPAPKAAPPPAPPAPKAA